MATYTRQNVWAAGGEDGWGGPLIWYARGIREMKDKRTDLLDNRTGWRFFGAMHDFNEGVWQSVKSYTPGEVMPKATDRAVFWRQCQHGSWYFLPWHRGYLMALENVVRAAVVKLGGPADWALPYWNYFQANQATLPPAFASPDWPDGKGDNPLYTPFRYGPDDPDGNGGGEVYVAIGGDNGATLDGMSDPAFISPDDNSTEGFGGIRTGFLNRGGNHGGIESHPHDDVHVLVGGGWNTNPTGLMTSPITAGLDPIFYLHHANIDRLWEVWKQSAIAQGDPSADVDWMNGPTTADPKARSFIMPRPDGTSWTYTPGDLHDLAKLDYTYDDLAAPSIVPAPQARLQALGIAPAAAAAVAAVAARRGAFAMAAASNTSELMGATGALRVSGADASASLSLDSGVHRRFAASLAASPETARPDRVFLRLENIKSNSDGVPLAVYIGLPDGTEHKAGNVSLFGVAQASQAGGAHAGDGMTHTIEVSSIIDRLHAQGALEAGKLTVRVVPRHPVPDSVGLSIGRISLYRRSG
jgi:tyrosinase